MSPPGSARHLHPKNARDCLALARAAGLESLDAHLLLAQATQQSRAWLLAHDEQLLPTEHIDTFVAWVQGAAQGQPLPYLTGNQHFMGLSLDVTPCVLIPRPDTETLARWALSLMPQAGFCRVADLGTGSGALALALKRHRPQAEVVAVDQSTAALSVARANADRLGLAVQWMESDWWSAVDTGPIFDVVVSNPPYIAENDPHLPDLRHEPMLALVSGPDGLSALRTIIQGAPSHLKPGAWLLLEHGHDQADAVQTLLRARGFSNTDSQRDLGHRWRCTGGQWCP